MLEPGTLWSATIERTDRARKCGAIHSIPTEYELIEENGIHFLVRVLSQLAKKDKETRTQKQSGKDFNPFLPYDENLFVADVSDTHVCLLNKYNVVEHHLLVVTRHFEPQQSWLSEADFAAILTALREIDGLAFYNGGRVAGASQPHKHLQLVPLPLIPEGGGTPIDPAIAAMQYNSNIGTSAKLPFNHAIAPLDSDWYEHPQQGALAVRQRYFDLLRAVGLIAGDRPETEEQTAPYNLLATREWMLLVGRSRECFESISVNSLGFAGALLVRNAEQMQRLKAVGPMAVLRSVAQGE